MADDAPDIHLDQVTNTAGGGLQLMCEVRLPGRRGLLFAVLDSPSKHGASGRQPRHAHVRLGLWRGLSLNFASPCWSYFCDGGRHRTRSGVTGFVSQACEYLGLAGGIAGDAQIEAGKLALDVLGRAEGGAA